MKASASLVVPVLDEEGTIDDLVRRCVNVLQSSGRPFEIILVDDGSTDSSRERITQWSSVHAGRLVGIFLAGNHGQDAAVMRGFAHCEGELILTMDADLQNPPEELPRLLEKLDAGYDFVGSVRRDRQDPWARRVASRMINRAVRSATGTKMRDYGCMLRGYDKRVVDELLSAYRPRTFMTVLGSRVAHRATDIEVGHEPRLSGSSKYSALQMLEVLTCLGRTLVPGKVAGGGPLAAVERWVGHSLLARDSRPTCPERASYR